DGGAGVQTNPDRQRPRRERARARIDRRMDGRASGCAGQISQLVECAESLGAGAGRRSGRVPRVVDGEFSLDPARENRPAVRTKTDERSRGDPPARSKVFASLLEGWKFWWALSAR